MNVCQRNFIFMYYATGGGLYDLKNIDEKVAL